VACSGGGDGGSGATAARPETIACLVCEWLTTQKLSRWGGGLLCALTVQRGLNGRGLRRCSLFGGVDRLRQWAQAGGVCCCVAILGDLLS
jgi:hypothetical protein